MSAWTLALLLCTSTQAQLPSHAPTTIIHQNHMGSPFQWVALTYVLDGTAVFTRIEDGLAKQKELEILSDLLPRGVHHLEVVAIYRNAPSIGCRLSYRFTVRSQLRFRVPRRGTVVVVEGYARGDRNTPIERRPAARMTTYRPAPR